jgi:hypothetical protein
VLKEGGKDDAAIDDMLALFSSVYPLEAKTWLLKEADEGEEELVRKFFSFCDSNPDAAKVMSEEAHENHKAKHSNN